MLWGQLLQCPASTCLGSLLGCLAEGIGSLDLFQRPAAVSIQVDASAIWVQGLAKVQSPFPKINLTVTIAVTETKSYLPKHNSHNLINPSNSHWTSLSPHNHRNRIRDDIGIIHYRLESQYLFYAKFIRRELLPAWEFRIRSQISIATCPHNQRANSHNTHKARVNSVNSGSTKENVTIQQELPLPKVYLIGPILGWTGSQERNRFKNKTKKGGWLDNSFNKMWNCGNQPVHAPE